MICREIPEDICDIADRKIYNDRNTPLPARRVRGRQRDPSTLSGLTTSDLYH